MASGNPLIPAFLRAGRAPQRPFCCAQMWQVRCLEPGLPQGSPRAAKEERLTRHHCLLGVRMWPRRRRPGHSVPAGRARCMGLLSLAEGRCPGQQVLELSIFTSKGGQELALWSVHCFTVSKFLLCAVSLGPGVAACGSTAGAGAPGSPCESLPWPRESPCSGTPGNNITSAP